jgi:hypothetical protein
MLKVLLPTTLPTAMSRSPLMAAMMEVATSGMEVPAATMVRPITRSLTPSDLGEGAPPPPPASLSPAPAGARPTAISSSCTGSGLSQRRRRRLDLGGVLVAGGLGLARDCTTRNTV